MAPDAFGLREYDFRMNSGTRSPIPSWAGFSPDSKNYTHKPTVHINQVMFDGIHHNNHPCKSVVSV